MAALTENSMRNTQKPLVPIKTYFDVPASTEIFKGAICHINAAGEATPVDGVATKIVAGIAAEYYKSGASATTNKPLPVEFNHLVWLPTGALTKADIGKAVYASDDNTVTLTSLNNCLIGTIADFRSGEVLVHVHR